MTLQWARRRLKSPASPLILNRLFGRRSKKTSKLRVTGLCAGNSPATGEFPAQKASYEEDVSIWWRHHDEEQSGAAVIITVTSFVISLINLISLLIMHLIIDTTKQTKKIQVLKELPMA